MADKGQGDSLQGTPSPPPCANGCGFFGSASTMNMCSKCFRECQKSSPATTSPTPSSPIPEQTPSSSVAAAAAAAAAASVSSSTPSPGSVAVPVPVLAIPMSTTSPASSLQMGDSAPALPSRKVQKNRSRCFSCRRKIGLTGFECRCGYFFCAEHRYSDQHDCDFDYQTKGREQLAKDNPVIVAPKLDKI